MKAHKITKFAEIDLKDPQKEQKISIINGTNRLSDLMTSIRRDQENLLLLIGTFFLGLFVSSFFKSIVFYLTFGIILLIFLILATRKNNKDFNQLYHKNNTLIKKGNNLGMNLKQDI